MSNELFPDQSPKFSKKDRIKIINDNTDEVYEVTQISNKIISTTSKNWKVSLTSIFSDKTCTHEGKYLRYLREDEKLACKIRLRELTASTKKKQGKPLSLSVEKPSENDLSTENRLSVPEITLGTQPIPASEEIKTPEYKASEISVATFPVTNTPVNLTEEPQIAESNADGELIPEIERLLNSVFDRRDQELKKIPELYQFVVKLADALAPKLNGEKPQLQREGKTCEDVLQSLKSLQRFLSNTLDVIHTQVMSEKTVSNEREAKIRSLNGEVTALDKEIRDLKALRGNEMLALTNLQEQVNILQTQITNLETDKNELSSQVETRIQEKQEANNKYEQQEGQMLEAAKELWKARIEFYQALHRGITQERDGTQLNRLKRFRQQSLETDIALLRSFGFDMILESEALNYERIPYDGADHQRHYGEAETIMTDEKATVFLPGWKRDGMIYEKPALGSGEVRE